jgi:HAD superfamily hydrolase (TIGR01509 family)
MTRSFGIIFDVDGVIADSETVNVRATAEAFREIVGIDQIQTDDFREGIGRGAEEYVKAGARAHNRELSADEVAALVQARQENFLAILRNEELPAFPGVLELIADAMQDERFDLAIATSSTREKSMAVLQSARVPYSEMVYICGDDVTRKKPDPELFQIACRRLDLPPASCVVIEDAPNGVAAAKAAGCRVIAVTNTCGRNELAEADVVVDCLTEVSLDTATELLRR